MSERLVDVDRETPMLLPVDLRDCVPGDNMVHFVVNRRGTGSPSTPTSST